MITITEKAIEEVKRVMQEQNMTAEETALKVGVAGGGCSGFQYALGFEKKEALDSKTFLLKVVDGVTVGVDKKSDLFLDGTIIDFYAGLEKRGFTFENPQTVKGCGCGQSFSC